MGKVPGEPSRLDFAVLSAKMTGVALASYVPLNAAKLLALRVVGARVGRGCGLHHGLVARAPSGISIGSDCWIAEDVSLDGRGGLEIGDHVAIGEGAVVAAGAGVPKDVPPWTLVGGVPAKVLGQRPPGLRYCLLYTSDAAD